MSQWHHVCTANNCLSFDNPRHSPAVVLGWKESWLRHPDLGLAKTNDTYLWQRYLLWFMQYAVLRAVNCTTQLVFMSLYRPSPRHPAVNIGPLDCQDCDAGSAQTAEIGANWLLQHGAWPWQYLPFYSAGLPAVPILAVLERAAQWGSKKHGTRNMKRETNVMS